MATDVFENLRVTTIEVTSPLIELLRVRGNFIKLVKSYIEESPDNLRKYEMIELYNTFAAADAELVEVIQGKIDNLPRGTK